MSGLKQPLDVAFSILVMLLPFLHQYAGIGSISFGEFVLAPFIIVFLLIDQRELTMSMNHTLLYFYCLSLLLSIVGGFPFPYFSISDFASVAARLIYYGLLVLVARRHFLWCNVKKLYFFLVTASAIYLILQYIYHSVTGLYLPITLNDSWVFGPEKTFDVYTEKYLWYFRPSSLFLEPSYYALFVLPCFAFSLFSSSDKSIARAFLLLITFVLSSSNSGLLISGTLIVGFILFAKKGSGDYLAASLALLLIVLYYAMGDTSSIESAIKRVFEGGSADNRITRGYIAYGSLDIYHQLFGTGLNNLGNYLDFHHISTGFDSENLNYCASIPQTLCYSGLLGASFLFAYLINLGTSCRSPLMFSIFLIILLVLNYESALFSYRFAFLVIILESQIGKRNLGSERAEVNLS